MRFALICAAAALATGSVCAAAAPAAAASAATTAKDAKAKKPRMVCRRDTATGSTIPKKICRTVVETPEPAKQAEAAAPAAGEAGDGAAAE